MRCEGRLFGCSWDAGDVRAGAVWDLRKWRLNVGGMHFHQRIAAFWRGQYDERVSFSETVFLFVLALVVFGPKKLPEIARQLGKLMAEFRRASNEFKSQIEQEIAHLEVEDRRKSMLAAVPPPEGTASRKPITTRGELTTFEAPATLAATPEPPTAESESPNPTVVATEAVPSSETGTASATETGAHLASENGVGSTNAAGTPVESHESSREQQESHA